MKRKMLLTVGIIALFAFAAKAQVCGSPFNFETVQRTDPARYSRFMRQEEKTAAYINSAKQGRLIDANSTIIIPVVVHVLNNGEPVGAGNNISDAQVQSEIDVLNENFRNLNPARGNIPAPFAVLEGDANIEFRLACTDPNGNPTTGIHRVQTNVAAFNFVAAGNVVDENTTGIKFTARGGTDAWPTDHYLNIWVCNIAPAAGSQLLGYAQFPADYAAKPTTDGVVILNTAFGRMPPGTIIPDDMGSTTAHEVGHWLNLFHIWGDDGGACTGSDQCDDTPNQADAHQNCPGFPFVSCGNGPNGDMFMNYMDYTVVGCNRTMFTAGQVARMRSVFTAGGVRAGFVNNYFALAAQPTTICNTGTIAVTNPGCLAGVAWSISGPATIAPNGNTAVITASGYGTATVTVTAGGYTDSRNITIAPVTPPTPVMSWRGNCPGTIGYCANSGTYYVLNPVAGATYQYSYDGTNWTSTATPPSFYVPCDGGIDVYIRMVGCTGNVSGAAHQVSHPLPDRICFPPGHGQRSAQSNTGDSSDVNSLFISPNPSTGRITVTLPNNRFLREIRLVNVLGVVVKRAQYTANIHTATVYASGLATGVYILQVYDGAGWTNRQMVIQ